MAKTQFKFFDYTDKTLSKMAKAQGVAVTKGCLMAEDAVKSQITSQGLVDTGALRASVTHSVKTDGKKSMGKFGSNLDYAIYQEYGTGQFAENGGGRKGGWAYTGRDGKRHFTYGTKPKKFFRTAVKKSASNISTAVTSEFRSQLS